MRYESRCVGCCAPIVYQSDDLGSGAPFFEPVEDHCASYAHGHLCPPCTGAVKELLEARRDQRESELNRAERLRRGDRT